MGHSKPNKLLSSPIQVYEIGSAPVWNDGKWPAHGWLLGEFMALG